MVRALRTLLVLCALTGLAARAQQPAFRVQDLNTDQPAPGVVHPDQESATVGGLFFFVTDDGIHGEELWVSDGSPAGTSLAADLCPGACSSHPHHLTAFSSQRILVFAADDGVHGEELWRSDGTATGTRMVLDFADDDRDDAVESIFEHDGKLFFSASDPFWGREIWKWDGTNTPFSIVLTANINPFGSSIPRVLAASGNGLLVAATDGVHGWEPWVIEGPYYNSATMLADVHPDPDASGLDPRNLARGGPDAIAAPWGGFVFVASDGTHGRELWVTDGTPAGTALLKDIAPGSDGSDPYGLTVLDGAVYFAAADPQNGAELWRTDGTTAGTGLVRDLWPGSQGSEPLEITPWGNRLYFQAADGVLGYELWATDGTTAGTVMVKDVYPGTLGAFGTTWRFHSGLSVVGDRLLFFAADTSGVRLWKSDGTTAGTVPADPPLQSPFVWPFSYSIFFLEDGYGVAGGFLFFRGDFPGDEIWRTNGTAAGTALLKDTRTDTSAFLVDDGAIDAGFGTLDGSVFFQATDGVSGLELWRSDGAPAGTGQVVDLAGGFYNSFPRPLGTLDGQLLFSALTDDLSDGTGLWATDGTPEGTRSLGSPSVPDEIGIAGGQAFFAADTSATGTELWKTDGTPAGTGPVGDLFPGPESSLPGQFVTVGSRVFFTATDEAGTELWVSDGTAPGTFRVADIRPEADPIAASSDPLHLTAVGNLVFFSADTGSYGRELWKSDGTVAGTVQVKDIFPANEGSISFLEDGIFAAPAGGPLFFVADDGQGGPELWKSDGTEAGTVLVKDLNSSSLGSSPRQLTVVGNRVYFTADVYPYGRELWVSDGTEAGTHLVEDIVPGLGSSRPRHLTAVDGRTLVFSAFDGLGVEPWRGDGTAVGTRRLADIAPGALSSSPVGFTAAGANLYFAANDNATGFELWAIPQAIARSTFQDVPTTYWAWPYVESLAASGFTRGCADGFYCPSRSITRAEVATSLGRVIHGADFVPPAVTATRFNDVPASHWAASWIEQFASDGFTRGCSAAPPLFCPESDATRAQMSQFLLRALHGAGYTPPPATGTRFADVPASHWAADWIEQLAAEGITNGCAPNLYCPDRAVGRDEMAAFLVKALHLPLP